MIAPAAAPRAAPATRAPVGPEVAAECPQRPRVDTGVLLGPRITGPVVFAAALKRFDRALDTQPASEPKRRH